MLQSLQSLSPPLPPRRRPIHDPVLYGPLRHQPVLQSLVRPLPVRQSPLRPLPVLQSLQSPSPPLPPSRRPITDPSLADPRTKR